MKVLYLSEWYPNIYDISSGRFVRAHAQSVVRQGVDVCVLSLFHTKNNDRPQTIVTNTTGIKEVYIYYSDNFLSALIRGWKYVKLHWGMPDLCQLNVITKNALLPLWLKHKYKIPYIVVEHWTGYYPQVKDYDSLGFFHHLLAKSTVRYATAVLTVSSELADYMQQCGLKNNNYRVIRNVVFDDFFVHRKRNEENIKRILNVAFFTDVHKNQSDIVRAINLLSQQRQDFQLVMAGGGKDLKMIKQLAKDLSIPDNMIRFTGEIMPDEVADLFYQSDFFVFYSNYETAGIVLTESLVCGKPIISTAVGIAPEIVTQETGMIVDKRNPQALAQAINYMLDHYKDYNTARLYQIGEQFSMQNVGQYLYNVYQSCKISE